MTLDIDRMRASLEPLTRARARAAAEGAAHAVAEYLAAGQRLLEIGNPFAATAVFEEALRVVARTNLEPEKLELSRHLDAAIGRTALDDATPAPQRTMAAFEHAARFWSETEQPFHGHRALCFACNESKAAAWIRCGACSALPVTQQDVAFSLLLSERACSFERLERLVRPDTRELAQKASHSFARALIKQRVPSIRPERQIAPGVLHSALDAARCTAVLIELITGTELVAAKPAVLEFVKELAVRMLDGRGEREHRQKLKELRHRLGTSIDVGRVAHLSVTRGASAVSSLRALFNPRTKHPTDLDAQVVSAVAVKAEPPARQSSLVEDFAQTLATQLLALERESREEHVDIQAELLPLSFYGDPSTSVEDAIGVLGKACDQRLSLSAAARLRRRSINDADPSTFPGAQALRANRGA